MIIFPAIDISNGHAVRLKRGDITQATVYADDPVDLAVRWQNDGATWLHVIDLDGAFAGTGISRDAIARIAQTTELKIQMGGGIRDPETAEACFRAGATRLIIGTLALEQPDLFRQMCAAFPGRIGVSLDGENGRLKSRGWVKDTGRTIEQVAPELEDAGAAFLIYTDIERDGMQTGVNLAALESLLRQTRLPVIAAGGVATLDDVRAIQALAQHGNLEGAISGRALCEGSLRLSHALEWLERNRCS